MTKIVCISDTHGRHDAVDVPDGDILIHAGDFTMMGRVEEIARFNDWLGAHPHRHKIVVAGNHDLLFEQAGGLAVGLLTNALYLRDSSTFVEGLKIYGSPWQPEFNNWAFNLPRGEALRRKWELIPEDVNILVTHGPPRMFLDEVREAEYVGCAALQARVLVVRPRLHVFGHIHEGYGTEEFNGIQFVNASVCDGQYRPINAPVVVELIPNDARA